MKNFLKNFGGKDQQQAAREGIRLVLAMVALHAINAGSAPLTQAEIAKEAVEQADELLKQLEQ